MKKRLYFMILAVCLMSSFSAFGASQKGSERVSEQGVYLGTAGYGTLDKTEKENFFHRFFIDGTEKHYTIQSKEDYAIQNMLAEGYLYDLSVENGMVVQAQEAKPSAQGTITEIRENSVFIGGKEIAFNESTEVFQIKSRAGGAAVTETELSSETKGLSAKVYGNNIYLAFLPSSYEPPVRGIPGQHTLKNFLATAMEPVGTVLYVYGGGWDWQDEGSSSQAVTIGLPKTWVSFFQSQEDSYNYKDPDPAKSYYPFGGWNQYYFAGADCSAYVAWTIYNVMNEESGREGYVMASTKMAKSLAQEKGFGAWTQEVNDSKEFQPGDIFSMNGHVWICLGGCGDGSLVILHSTPSDSKSGSPGGGVQISGLGETEDCQAVQLARYYMKAYFPDWSSRYDAVFKKFSDYTAFTGDSAGRFSWSQSEAGLLDPDGYHEMSAAEILADLFGEKPASPFNFLQESLAAGVKRPAIR